MHNLSNTEKQILNRIQKDWIICKTPFQKLAEELKIGENTLIHTIDVLKQKKIIRDISAIFNAVNLGYESALIAFEVSEENVESAAAIINAHPGVSHNYLRNHKYNIWFTITVNRNITIEAEAAILVEKSKAKDYLVLRNEKLFKIKAQFHIGDSNGDSEYFSNYNKNIKTKFNDLSQDEKKAVYILQTDLPLNQRPFKLLSEQLNVDIDESKIAQIGEKFKQTGVIRRYSAVLKHTNAGYKANAMTAWKLGNFTEDDICKTFSDISNISHLYLRTVYPGKWEHGLFAMIHARTEAELTEIIKKLEKESGIKDYLVLRSLKEFKKKRVKYFTEEF